MKMTFCLLFVACLAFVGCQPGEKPQDTKPTNAVPAATNVAPAK